jgi:hypothetical protein
MKNLLFAFLMMTFVSALFAQDGDFHLNKDYKMKKSGLIDLRCSDAKVFVTGSDQTNAHIKIDRKVTNQGLSWGARNFTVDVEEDDGNLKIRERHSVSDLSIIGFTREEYKIDIAAPEGASLTVRADDGDYYIKNINGSISLSMDDADVELSDCKGNEFNFRIDDGDIRMDKGSGSIDIDADDGNVELYNAHFNAIHANMDDGDLKIETSLSDQGEYQIEGEDGSIALTITGGGGEFDIRHDDTHVVTQGAFKTLQDDDDHTVVSLQNGRAKIYVRGDDERIKLVASK